MPNGKRPPKKQPATEVGRGGSKVIPLPRTYAECVAQGGKPEMCRKAFPYKNQPQ